MASLPHHYPHLSLHLADRSLTPLISSSSPTPSSPPSPPRHDALARLASSALGVHEAASRLGLGAPQRVLIEYGPRGPLLIQTFLDPTAADAISAGGSGSGRPRPGVARPGSPSSTLAAAGPSGGAEGTRQPVKGASSVGTGTGAAQAAIGRDYYDDDHDDDRGGAAGTYGTPHYDDDDDNNNNDDDDEAGTGSSSPEAPPMLLGVIVAASPDESASARRATVRLEKIGRQIQEGWTAQGDRP